MALPTHPNIFTLVHVFSIISLAYSQNDTTQKRFPAILIFGDSLVDTGNNNYITTPLRANHAPYGESFPNEVPTGRFSDGKVISDFLASALALKELVPPVLDPKLTNEDILTGVCFASAGSGYHDLTNALYNSISVMKQPDILKSYVDKLKGGVGEIKAQKIIGDSMVVVVAGSNDFLVNYYGIPARRNLFGLNLYQNSLLLRVQDFVKALYDIGCRNIMVAGLPPLGCGQGPSLIFTTCLDPKNSDSQTYNIKLQELLPQIQATLPGSKLVYADIFTPFVDMVTNPVKYGFLVTTKGCCGTGTFETGPLCSPLTPVCSNPAQYVFWDSIHPTQTAAGYISQYLQTNALSQF
ncbi:unnamed protein product [Fraxinus pennsylvanica]|uniref:GDSL esterase/lipase n=1 Tax=Fraxinus pennsylvanica TaxID=56036 RepID=A0AAD1ZJQ0_9LAMI|nr:unnamed protein product [Fraxinus pennsylvanica]